MKTLLKRTIAALSSGYILMHFSEFLFYGSFTSEPLPIPALLSECLMLLAVYSALGYVVLSLTNRFRARSVWAIFLVGAVFGWLLEGIVVTTVYEDFPFQVHFTGLAWHAPLDVLLGWYAVQRLLRLKNPVWTLLAACAIGLFWGLWAPWRWWEDDYLFPVAQFTAFTTFTTLLLVIAYWLLGRSRPAEFRPTLWLDVVLSTLLALWFALDLLFYPCAVLVLPPLLLLTLLALWRNRRVEGRGDALATLGAEVRPLNLVMLMSIPVVASGVYAIQVALGTYTAIAPNAVFYVISSLAGIGTFLMSLVVPFLHRRATPAPVAAEAVP
jgi:hypothetical protein